MDIEELMDRAWPAPEREDSGGWVLRAARGVTQRANSVWPRESVEDHGAALRMATEWYRSRRLPLIFQVFVGSRSAALNTALDVQGFTRQSETLIMVSRDPSPKLGDGNSDAPTTAIEIGDEPSEEWLRLWWSVDGRGGDAELDVARSILTGCPSLYALVRDDDGDPAAVGRLAMVDGKGGIYCMATHAWRRRRGYAGRVLDALMAAGRDRGLEEFWLLVMASNAGARSLYEGAGFEEHGRYLYRQARPRRSLSGC
ncbi:GNAT family N-acetyltransferase [Arthrobacter sp. NyZ413]|uniref:GNAT family N-acetyltransferase n=1 Tax=Arthrobacter sp. NyZ413 TaxID=3144669 RepID=UPI003BF81450